MSPHLRKLLSRAFYLVMTLAVGVTITRVTKPLRPQSFSGVPGSAAGRVEALPQSEPKSYADETQRPADFLVNEDRSDYLGYTIHRRLRKALLDFGEETNVPNHWVDVGYVTVERRGERLRKFDADLYFGVGNTVDYGYFPFLNDEAQQLFISQDIPRGGCQWIVSLSPRLRVIFDGQALGVGREAWDLGVIDLDKDGIYEITAPITDFYNLHDKMSISQIPLPSIVFKYHSAREEYLPANATFRDHAFEEMVEVPSISNDLVGQFSHRSAVLNNLLIYVYAGEEKTGWEFFNSKYGLSDKAEIQRRVKSILGRQAVYNLIYKRGKN